MKGINEMKWHQRNQWRGMKIVSVIDEAKSMKAALNESAKENNEMAIIIDQCGIRNNGNNGGASKWRRRGIAKT
jgi:hypothetical protein